MFCATECDQETKQARLGFILVKDLMKGDPLTLISHVVYKPQRLSDSQYKTKVV